jgi:hypothetical protein
MNQSTIDYLKECVLDATADDYESVSSILPELKKWAASDGHQFSDAQLNNAIENLVSEGKLHVYRYSKQENKYLPTQYSSDQVKDLWFSSRP